ncbi:hypothetical protein TgHK011_002409 [Trichoderma gracile]|nr:hypothetical protein TgHK011_002409 [Trichoderma gracile]
MSNQRHVLFVKKTNRGSCLDSAAARVSGNHKSCNGFVLLILLGAGRGATVFSARDPHKSQGTLEDPYTHCSIPGGTRPPQASRLLRTALVKAPSLQPRSGRNRFVRLLLIESGCIGPVFFFLRPTRRHRQDEISGAVAFFGLFARSDSRAPRCLALPLSRL